MSYDGFYGELSTRGTVSELLNQANGIKVSIGASEAAVAADTSEVGWKHAEVTLKAAQVQTNANLVSTKAQEVALNASQVQTDANLVSTKAQEVTLNAAQVQTDANLVSTKAQEVQDNSDYVAGITAHYPPDVIGTTDQRLTDAREWTAETISQAEAEAGVATTRRAFTAQQVRQAIVAWFNGISGALGRTILTRTTAAQVRTDIGLGTAATENLTTSTLDGTVGRVLKVGDGGWMGQGEYQTAPYGYPTSRADFTNQTKTFYSNSLDNGVGIAAASFHFSADSTWGRLRVSYNSQRAWIQGGVSTAGVGWTSQVVLSASMLQTTGSSTEFPMSQKAVTDAINNSSIGVGQTWQNVMASRVFGTTYTNTTGRPIAVSVSNTASGDANNTPGISITVGGVLVSTGNLTSSGGNAGLVGYSASAIIPAGSTYICYLLGNASNRVVYWAELR